MAEYHTAIEQMEELKDRLEAQEAKIKNLEYRNRI